MMRHTDCYESGMSGMLNDKEMVEMVCFLYCKLCLWCEMFVDLRHEMRNYW